ncbi:hypothetical protein RCH19_002614 [Flavobacterium sp. PL12]
MIKWLNGNYKMVYSQCTNSFLDAILFSRESVN